MLSAPSVDLAAGTGRRTVSPRIGGR